MSAPSACRLALAPPARRAIAERLPEAVAASVIDFLTTTLVEHPHRLGTPLRGDLAGVRSARRGTYRVLFRIDDDVREVVVLSVEHRSSAYRPR